MVSNKFFLPPCKLRDKLFCCFPNPNLFSNSYDHFWHQSRFLLLNGNPDFILKTVLHRLIEEELYDVKSCIPSPASQPNRLWLPFVFNEAHCGSEPNVAASLGQFFP